MSSKSDLTYDEDKTPVEQLTYEQAFIELEQTIATLETDEQSLESALSLFERGQALAQRCADLLDKADLKVQRLMGKEVVDFEAEE
jgi:exodeoxyribonuclease VII small subunit